MTGTEHTLVALACVYLSYRVGKIVGSEQGYKDGFREAAIDVTNQMLVSLSAIYDINLKSDIEIKEDDE